MARSEKHYFRLGLFVLSGIALLIAFVFYLGLANTFQSRIRFVTLFQESVQGLATGAAVKYKGVPIGSVKAINILVDEQLIEVRMDIDPKVFVSVDAPWGANPESVIAFYRKEIANGLSCQLEFNGITGLKYVELNYFEETDPAKQLPAPRDMSGDMIYIASTPSVFSGILSKIYISLDKISNIDFEGISKSIKQSSQEFNEVMASAPLRNTLNRMESISANIDITTKSLAETLTSARITSILEGLDKTLADINALSIEMRKELKAANLAEASNNFSSAAASVKVLAESLDRSRSNFAWTVRKFEQVLDLSEELLEYLGKDPNSLLRGKQEPTISGGKIPQ